MLKHPMTRQYRLVFFQPYSDFIYNRSTNEAQTEFRKVSISKHRISASFGHHCNPYFAIWNALPMFQKHAATLTDEQKHIYRLLKRIWNAWNAWYKVVKPQGLESSQDKDQQEGESGLSPVVELATNTRQLPKHPASIPTPPISPSYKDTEHGDLGGSEDLEDSSEAFCHPDCSHVDVWLAGVAQQCDSLEEHSIAWPVEEIPRPPLQPRTARDRWSDPPDTAKFSSNDWAARVMGPYLMRSVSPSEPSRLSGV